MPVFHCMHLQHVCECMPMMPEELAITASVCLRASSCVSTSQFRADAGTTSGCSSFLQSSCIICNELGCTPFQARRKLSTLCRPLPEFCQLRYFRTETDQDMHVGSAFMVHLQSSTARCALENQERATQTSWKHWPHR